MKKIFILILCLMLLWSPIVAAAEENGTPTGTEEEGAENLPPETETPTEEEITPPETTPEETPAETPETPAETPTDEKVEWETVSDALVNWIYANYDKALVSIFLLLTAIFEKAREKRLNKNMGTINNNAITIANKSTDFMSQALSQVENASNVVSSCEASILALLEAYKQSAEDKLKLEKEFVELKEFLKTATNANIEFANELAELLGLANIPNYKKEEIGARHLAAVNAIIEAETKAEAAAMLPATTEEVKENVGKEKEN